MNLCLAQLTDTAHLRRRRSQHNESQLSVVSRQRMLLYRQTSAKAIVQTPRKHKETNWKIECDCLFFSLFVN